MSANEILCANVCNSCNNMHIIACSPIQGVLNVENLIQLLTHFRIHTSSGEVCACCQLSSSSIERKRHSCSFPSSPAAMEEISLCAEYVWYYYGGLAVLLGTALTGVFVLPYFNVPYGRFQANWIVSIPTWLGWLVMEAPSFISYVWMTWALTQASVSTFSWGSLITKPAILIPMTMWVVHYANRSFIYPFRLTSRNKPMSVLPVLSGVLFNVFNGSANAYALQCPRTALAIVPPGLRFLVSGHEYLDAAASTISSAASKQVFVSAVTVLGAVVMVLGWLINYHVCIRSRDLTNPLRRPVG